MATPLFEPYVVPFTLVILVVLFLMQSRGTGRPRPALRAGDVSLVPRPRRSGSRPDPRRRTFCGRSTPATLSPCSGRTVVGVRHAGRRLSRRHRRRGALRGHGALRPAADPARVVRHRPARASAQLLRSGRAAARRPRRGGQPVLPAGPRVGALPDGRARHLGHRDRVAGGDLGRLLAQRAGGAARLPAAAHRAPHVGTDDGPDLHPRDQLVAARRRRPAGPRLPVLEQPCRGLRHGGQRRHGDHAVLAGIVARSAGAGRRRW